MLTYYFDTLAADYSFFNVFRYLTFRAVCAVLTALALSLLIGPIMIRRLASMHIGATIRNDGPTSHYEKSGTPTMGGGLIVLALVVATLLSADLGNRFVWIAIATSAGFGVIGWMDDHQKLRAPAFSGLSAPNKFVLQSMVGFSAALVLYHTAIAPVETQLIVPFFKSIAIDLGMGFVVLAWFVIVGASNAVNLTDGLDGLAVLPSALVAGGLGVFAYVSGHAVFSGYLGIPYIVGAGEMMVFCAALVGAGLGFLWFNTYPAQVFMGDVGALTLGAALGTVAVIVRQEIVLAIMGGIFVIETLSVILQVVSFRLTGRRVFKMAPLHHHFELKGWPEPRVSVRFWIISLVLVLAGIATLKIR